MVWIVKGIFLVTTLVLVQGQLSWQTNGTPRSMSDPPGFLPPSRRPPRPPSSQSTSGTISVAPQATKQDTVSTLTIPGVPWEGQQPATQGTSSTGIRDTSKITIGEQILQQQQKQQPQQYDMFGFPIPASDPFDLFGPSADPFGGLFSSSPGSDPFFGGFGGASSGPSGASSDPFGLGLGGGAAGGGLGGGGLLQNVLLLRLLGGGDAPDPAPRRPGQPPPPRQRSLLEEVLLLEQRQNRRQMKLDRMRNRQNPPGMHDFPPQGQHPIDGPPPPRRTRTFRRRPSPQPF